MSDRMPCGCTVGYTTQFGVDIKYCWRHGDNHALAGERRRYALLNAAATLYPFCAYRTKEDDLATAVDGTITVAEKLLAEIEKREVGK